MLVYQELVELFSKEVIISERPLKRGKGFYVDGTIFIDYRLSEKEKVETLLEEWGHYKTTTKNILDLKNVWNSKEEHQAMDYAIKHFLSKEDIKGAYIKASAEKNDFEIADSLNITPYMLKEACKYYKRKQTTQKAKKTINGMEMLTMLDRIKIEAKKKGLTIEQVDKKCNFESGTIKTWDNNFPTVDKIQRVAKLLDASLDYIVLGAEGKINRFVPGHFTPEEEIKLSKLIDEQEWSSRK